MEEFPVVVFLIVKVVKNRQTEQRNKEPVKANDRPEGRYSGVSQSSLHRAAPGAVLAARCLLWGIAAPAARREVTSPHPSEPAFGPGVAEEGWGVCVYRQGMLVA